MPSTVRPWTTSIRAAAGAKPESACVRSLRAAGLAPVGARLVARVAPLAFTVLTESGTTERAPGPVLDGAEPGRLETRSSSSSVAPGASLKPNDAVGPAGEIDGQRLVRIELQGDQALGLAGALRGEHGAAGAGGLDLGLAQRLADGVGGGPGRRWGRPGGR